MKEAKLKIQQLYEYDTEIENMLNSLKDTMGDCIESPIMALMFKLFNYSQDLIEQLIDDNGEWVNWFIYENNWGKNQFAVRLPEWENDMIVENIDDLLFVIKEDNKRE